MAEKKFAGNIVTEDFMPEMPPEIIEMLEEQEKAGNVIDRTMMFAIQDSFVKGSFFAGCEWVWGVTGDGVQCSASAISGVVSASAPPSRTPSS